ncbi:MAG TPA: hypothetical protein VLB45_05280 [Nitrosopumilaceae archaeon]|nr:hypothetical protein [Nitrosopumilaceae archaeon]
MRQAFSIISKKYMPIIIGVAAAIIATTAAYAYVITNGQGDLANKNNDFESIILDQDAQTYRINTQCEMIFAMTEGQYPDGESMPRIEITSLLEKYPDEFKEWKAILEDPVKRQEFAQEVPREFNEVLIPIMMKEASINPELEPTAMLLIDPQASTKIKQAFDENSCQEFFDSRQVNP